MSAARSDWHSAAIDRFEPLAGGYANHNFRFQYAAQNQPAQSYVLRLSRQPLTAEQHRQMRWEVAYRERLAESSLCTAPLIGADTQAGVLLTGWVEGSHAHEVARLSPGLLDDWVVQLAQLLPSQSRTYDPLQGLADVDSLPATLRSLGSACADWLTSQSQRFVPCHNDLNPYNVLWSGVGRDAPIFLDWEMAGLNHPGFDRVALQLGIAREQSAAALARASRRLRLKLGPHAHWLLCCYWFREYVWAAQQLQQGNHVEAVQGQQALALAQLDSLRSG